jgi:hypothetical protein
MLLIDAVRSNVRLADFLEREMHILEEWRIRDVEQKAERANQRLYKLDALHNDVGNLERANRELCSCIDGLRSALEAGITRIETLEEMVNVLSANV